MQIKKISRTNTAKWQSNFNMKASKKQVRMLNFKIKSLRTNESEREVKQLLSFPDQFRSHKVWIIFIGLSIKILNKYVNDLIIKKMVSCLKNGMPLKNEASLCTKFK